MDEDLAKSSIRVSLGKDTTEDDINYFVDTLNAVLNRMFTLA